MNINLAGEVINSLKVIEQVKTPEGKKRARGPWWRCECLRCGNTEYVATSGDLRTGRITSCGCFRNSQEFADNKVVHGHRRQKKGVTSRAYNAWQEMKKRCDTPSTSSYSYYGGRGITYCARWVYFENFIEDMGDCPPELELDRKDNNGNYCKENCRWVSHKENCNNRG